VARHLVEQVLVLRVAEQVFRLDVVVAAIQVGVALEHQLLPARLGVHAHRYLFGRKVG
jgi:hypothetical protein